jgi:ankyrin repeat protein
MAHFDRLFAGLAYRSVSLIFFSVLISLASVARADATDDFILAIKFDDVKAVQTLLKKGMDINVSEPIRGETAMMIALRENSTKVFDALLHDRNIRLEARAHNGDTALMLASYLNNLAAVKQLIAFGAKINQSGWTALHYAAAAGNVQIMVLLLDGDAHINARSPNQTTPLMMAVRSGSTPAVELLIDRGADGSLINALGLTALDFAIQLEKKEIAAVLSASLKQTNKP